MTKKYIKNPISPEISEMGGASIMFVDKDTIPLDGSINDALAGNYCTGQKTLITNLFFGLMRSMAEGVVRDGHARQIGDFLTVYPVFKGKIDLDKGFDPEENSIVVRANLLNEMTLDISGWTFQDVTPGRKPFKLTTVKAGDIDGVIALNQAVEINGKDMPSTKAGEDLRIDWAVEDTALSGTIPTAKATSDVSRADITADALSALNVPANNGKTIVFTVRGNYANATIRAVLKYVAPTGPTLTRIEDEEGHVGPTIGAGHDQDFLIGTNLAEATSVTMNGTSAGTPYMLNCEIKAKTATKLTINIPTDKFVSGDNQVLLTVSTPAGIATLNANMEV